MVLRSEEQDELRLIFDMIDSHKKGVIESQEMGRALRLMGDNPKHIEIQRLVDIIRVECRLEAHQKDPEIDFHLFCVVLTPKLRLRSSTRDKDRTTATSHLKDAFKIFDKDGDGTISVDEFMHAMSSMGERLSKKEVKALMAEVDKDNNGTIDIDEFSQLMAGMAAPGAKK